MNCENALEELLLAFPRMAAFRRQPPPDDGSLPGFAHPPAAAAGEGGGPQVFTIGHSTRTLPEFSQLLKACGVERVVDVRTVPRSRHNPQFNIETLPLELRKASLVYSHLPELGGLRRPARESQNAGWENASFRGYADYMQTPEFAAGIEGLLALARTGPVAVMCAEAVPWRCHRSLIADALLARGVRAMHIISGRSVLPHQFTSFARVRGTRITYPPETARRR